MPFVDIAVATGTGKKVYDKAFWFVGPPSESCSARPPKWVAPREEGMQFHSLPCPRKKIDVYRPLSLRCGIARSFRRDGNRDSRLPIGSFRSSLVFFGALFSLLRSYLIQFPSSTLVLFFVDMNALSFWTNEAAAVPL